ncbi:hypothetical protein BJX64DRAFT_123719 [Aspergillus heterothallicus]
MVFCLIVLFLRDRWVPLLVVASSWFPCYNRRKERPRASCCRSCLFCSRQVHLWSRLPRSPTRAAKRRNDRKGCFAFLPFLCLESVPYGCAFLVCSVYFRTEPGRHPFLMPSSVRGHLEAPRIASSNSTPSMDTSRYM